MQKVRNSGQLRQPEAGPEETADRLWKAADTAFNRLARYDPAIADNFQLPMCIGQQIACWSRPEFAAASEQTHMRDSDYVVGLSLQGHARAYPLWVCDHYHVINDRIDGTPVVFVSCERCQSGAAFETQQKERPLRFASRGIYNATLLMKDSGSDSSLWVHYEGAAITGPRRGTLLEWIPTFHMSWAEWRELYPDTDVMLAPRDPAHRDARHGHGREEYFARPGMDRAFVQTIVGHLDSRYPENEPVLGLNVDRVLRVYPLREVRLAGGVVAEEINGEPLAVLAGPRSDAVTMAAYSPRLGDRTLTFKRLENAFVDRETGSHWTITGAAVSGPLKGSQLEGVRSCYVRWHAWAHTHPGSEIYRWQEPRPLYRQGDTTAATLPFQQLLESIAGRSKRLEVEGPVVNLSLPHEAVHGLSIAVDGHRYLLFKFASAAAACDYVQLEGAWFCMPLGVHVERRRSLQLGRVALVSDPEVQYADPCNVVRLPDEQIQWGPMVDGFAELQSPDQDDAPAADNTFSGLLEHLRGAGFDVVEVAFLPHSQLRVGTISAVAATVNGVRCAVYKCLNETGAGELAHRFTEAIPAGRFVFRPTPIGMHEDPINEIGMRPTMRSGGQLASSSRSCRLQLWPFCLNLDPTADSARQENPMSTAKRLPPPPSAREPSWSLTDASDLYQIEAWGKGYFKINDHGHLVVRPENQAGQEIDLASVVEQLRGQGLTTPLRKKVPPSSSFKQASLMATPTWSRKREPSRRLKSER